MSDKQPQTTAPAATPGSKDNAPGSESKQTAAGQPSGIEGGVAPAQAPKPKPKPKGPPAGNAPVKPAAPSARRRRRHVMLMLSFVLLVVLPVMVVGTYLATKAEDQYASTLGFIVRKEELSSAVEILGGLTQLSGSSSSDTDILYEFIQSQQMVSQIDKELGLRAMFSRHHDSDPIFAFDPDGTIEDLLAYWSKMVKIYYDTGSGLIELQVKAFDPDEAQAIAQAIFDDSSEMINQLSAIARLDTTRYTREELEQSVERLKDAREALAQFRSRTRIIDPQADIQGQMGLLNNLQQQLATALIESDLLIQNTREGDPRLLQAGQRIEVIRKRIAEERRKFTMGGQDSADDDYVNVLSEFERLSVDREFAEQAYVAALSAFDSAQAEAQRKSRYLAAYITPTLPEKSEYPQRLIIAALTLIFLLLIWSVGVLVYYSIKDRR